jgi:hypothetical protein
MKRSILLLVSFSFALVVLVFILWWNASRTRYARIKERLMSVRIGMSRTEVLAVVGKPEFAKTVAIGLDTNGLDTYVEMWVFPNSASASEFPRCFFGLTNGTVVQVVVDEGYRSGGIDQRPATFR